MTQKPANTLIEQAEAAGLVLFSSVTALPRDGSAPEWITLFPKVGKVETRDDRAFEVSASVLMEAYRSDGILIPVDVNHSTDMAGLFGGRADAVGWGTELREHDGGLQIKIDWLEEGRALLAARKYLYTSPSFYQNEGVATRLKAVALVTSPALARQPALANAGLSQEPSMKSIARALGLAEASNEAECLTGLATMRAGMVDKAVHDEAIAKLGTATTELANLKTAARNEKVTALIDGALKDKKILPAQKDVYVAMCSTDDGLGHVEKLLAATAPAMPGSGLDDRPQPTGEGGAIDAMTLSAAAQKIQDDRQAAGQPISFSEAITLAGKKATAA